jgi:peptide/nickel transport system substrate-binding protein
MILILCTCGWMLTALAEQRPAPRGELRIVDKRWSNRFSIENHVIEPLVEMGPDGTLVPRLASGWRWHDARTLEVTLRQGVTFHNGEVLDAEIVRLNLESNNEVREFWGPDLTWLLFPPETRFEVLAPHTLQLVLPAPVVMAPLWLAFTWITNRQYFRHLDQLVQELQLPRSQLHVGGPRRRPGPWGTGPYQLVAGQSQPNRQTEQIVLEAYPGYWDATRYPQVQRLVFDHTLTPKEAQERVMTSEGQVDLFVDMRPIDTLRVAQSPLAKVVKERSSLTTVLGFFNTRKANSPWHEVRLRQAANYAINREDFLRYAAKGNGMLVPALLPPGTMDFDATLPPYSFDPTAAQRLLREAGPAEGLALTLIAPEELEVQATVVSKMLEHVGVTVLQRLLNRGDFYKATNHWYFVSLQKQQQPAPWPTWDIALMDARMARGQHSPLILYYEYVFSGSYDWVDETPALRQFLMQLRSTSDPVQQQAITAQMERHIRDQASFLFLYAPLQLYAVNKEVNFEPHPSGLLFLPTTSVTDQHWSVRQQTTTMHE